MPMPPLITDLAIILIAAGLVTIIFKRLQQPLVLGYIVAGFLAGPHMPYTPSVQDFSSIDTWSEIGVIFLMFTLGLEFSFKKVLRMGVGPIVAACTIICCMMGIGGGIGHFFGWSGMNCLFLGGMLAMSSTTIIYKAFDDLGMRRQKFAGEVLSVLILEDILGILLMVVLSALAVSREFQGLQLFGALFKLGFFLILWFIVGVYVVPLFLRRNIKWMNSETLLILAIGLCFLLVVVAAQAGYSAAFGAFMMGSILAETLEAEHIERVVAPVKDLFGAIFFVSVGMLVDPQILADYLLPICVITGGILLGQTIFGTCSYLLSGQSLKVAMQCGFSMAQIGEFAFIIASLGISLHVMDDFLYPVVVAVSIITTFLTPYMIRAALPAYRLLERLLPSRFLVDRRPAEASGGTASPSAGTASLWRSLLKALLAQSGIYLTLTSAVCILTLGFALPMCRHLLGYHLGNALCGLITLLTMSPFLRAVVMRKNHSVEFRTLSRSGRRHLIGLWGTLVVRFLFASAFVFYVILRLTPDATRWGLPEAIQVPLQCLLSMGIVLLMVASRRVKFVSIRLERTFRQNLRLREVKAAAADGRTAYGRRLLSHDMHLAQISIPDNSRWGGCLLRDLGFSRTDGVLIAAIVRGSIRINIPSGRTALFPGDKIDVIGDDQGVQAFARRLHAEVDPATPDDAAHRLELRRLRVPGASAFVGKTVAQSGIRDTYHCLVVGFEGAADGVITTAAAHRAIRSADILWLAGEAGDLTAVTAALMAEAAPQPLS